MLAVGFPIFTGCDDDPKTIPPWSAAFDTGEQGAFLSAWGPNHDDIWTVGGQLAEGVVWRRQAGQWNAFSVPEGPLLNWVHGTGEIVWVVGNAGRTLRRIGEGEFETITNDESQPLWGVWAASPDRAWAVGGDALSSGEPDPVILEWDGDEWHRVELPPIDRTFRAFFKVWGTGPDNVYAIGGKGVILHFDGEAWVQEFAGTARDFVSLWGTGPNDIVAVGGRVNGMVARWNGVQWQHEVLPGQPGLNGVWLDAGGLAWIVGARGRILRMKPNGFSIESDASENQILLHGVFGADDGYRVTVGGTLDERPPWTGVVLETTR
jgi:hypothetical protein